MSSPPAPEASAPAINVTAPTPMSPPPAAEADSKEVAPPLPEKEIASENESQDDGASVNQFSDEKIFYDPSQQPAKDGESSKMASEKLDRNGTVSSTSTQVASPVDVKATPSPPYAKIDENAFPEPVKDRETLPEVIEDRETLPDVQNGAAPSPMTPDDIGYSPNQDMATKALRETLNTVTPLHLLQDQPDTVDCPFCRRQALTEVKKVPSPYTHAWCGFCFVFGIFVGAVAPYILKWNYDTDHICTNCNRKVATRRSVKNITRVHGTPEHLREVSRFPAA